MLVKNNLWMETCLGGLLEPEHQGGWDHEGGSHLSWLLQRVEGKECSECGRARLARFGDSGLISLTTTSPLRAAEVAVQ